MAARIGRPRGRSGAGGRRLFALTVTGVVALALTFIVGVMIGRQWTRSHPPQVSSAEARKSAAAPRRALSDAEAVKPPQIQEKLTFYQTLTAPLGATPPPPRPPAPKAESARPETPRPEARDRPDAGRDRPTNQPDAPAAAPERGYTVQVVAYRARAAAEEMERKLKRAGFEAYVATTSGDDGHATYRVRVGSFPTRAEALQLAERLRNERGLAPFVTSR